MKKNVIINILLIVTILFPSMVIGQSQFRNKIDYNTAEYLTGEEYITGEDGVVRMNLNIWGHVKYPGTYLVYDGVNLLTCLSLAGGPLKGARLSKITIISKDGQKREIDLKSFIDKDNAENIRINSNDTIIIDETLFSYIVSRSNIYTFLLQLTNLFLIAR